MRNEWGEGQGEGRIDSSARMRYSTPMNPKHNARRLRRSQTQEEKQLWRALRAGRFAGFKFRRQEAAGKYFLDFFCAFANLSVELDGFQHGAPEQRLHDRARAQWLDAQGIEELRYWNHQWRENSEGVLLEIWQALHRRTGCMSVERKKKNQRFLPPPPEQLTKRPLSPLVPHGAREKKRAAAGWQAITFLADRCAHRVP